MDERRKKLHVPPEATTLPLLTLTLLGFGLMLGFLWQNHEPVPLYLWLILLFLFDAFLVFCKEYTISERYLIVRFLGIPYRWVSWEKVSGCAYVSGMKAGGRYNPTVLTCIIITLRPRLPFAETTFPQMAWFLLRNRFFSYQLFVPKGKEEEYLKVLEELVNCPVMRISV